MDDKVTTKDLILRLMNKVDVIAKTQTEHGSALKSIGQHSEDTNGKVAQAIRDIQELEDTVYREDKKLFRKIARYGVVALVITSFVFIKETRDIIIELVKIIL